MLINLFGQAVFDTDEVLSICNVIITKQDYPLQNYRYINAVKIVVSRRGVSTEITLENRDMYQVLNEIEKWQPLSPLVLAMEKHEAFCEAEELLRRAKQLEDETRWKQLKDKQ